MQYRKDESLKLLARLAAVLPLVPVHLVEDVWLNALEENDDESHNVVRFKDYVTETWVGGQQLNVRNHCDNDGARITNNVEGWHVK